MNDICSYGVSLGIQAVIMQTWGWLWTIDPDAIAESLSVCIMISSCTNCPDKDNRSTDQYLLFSVQSGYLDVRARGGSAISDAVVDIATLLVMKSAIVRNLIVIANVDCRMLA